MCKKIIQYLGVILLLSGITTIFPQSKSSVAAIKRNVFLVRTDLPESMKAILLQIAYQLEKNLGEEGRTAARYFSGIAAGGTGTAFLVRGEDGKVYAITNRHVVEYAETATLESHAENVHKHLRILYVDRDVDLAVLEFRGELSEDMGPLTLSTKLPDEATEVIAAGYPGLGDRPSWQITKGSISNNNVKSENLGAEHAFMQHSAQIDPGNSGGPLLAKVGKSYEVIGVNTLTIRQRQNTNMAIPARYVEKILKKAVAIQAMIKSEKKTTAALEKSARTLASELSNEHPNSENISNLISLSMIGEQGAEAMKFTMALAQAKGTDAQKQLFSMLIDDPIPFMRKSITIQLMADVNVMSDRNIRYVQITEADKEDIPKRKTVRTEFRIGNETKNLVWIPEHGQWRLAKYNIRQANASAVNSNKNTTESNTQSPTCKMLAGEPIGTSLQACKDSLSTEDAFAECLSTKLIKACANANSATSCVEKCVVGAVEAIKEAASK